MLKERTKKVINNLKKTARFLQTEKEYKTCYFACQRYLLVNHDEYFKFLNLHRSLYCPACMVLRSQIKDSFYKPKYMQQFQQANNIFIHRWISVHCFRHTKKISFAIIPDSQLYLNISFSKSINALWEQIRACLGYIYDIDFIWTFLVVQPPCYLKHLPNILFVTYILYINHTIF